MCVPCGDQLSAILKHKMISIKTSFYTNKYKCHLGKYNSIFYIVILYYIITHTNIISQLISGLFANVSSITSTNLVIPAWICTFVLINVLRSKMAVTPLYQSVSVWHVNFNFLRTVKSFWFLLEESNFVYLLIFIFLSD